MAATINCPQCDAPLEVPDDIPSGKRLQCPDCGKSFAPPSNGEASRPAPHRKRHDEDDLPPRRGRSGSFVVVAAVVLIVLMGIGIAGAVVWVYLDDLRTREMAAQTMRASPAPIKNAGPIGGPPGQGGMMPGGAPGGGAPPGGGMLPGGDPGMMPGGGRGGIPAGGMAPVVRLNVGDAAPEITGEDLDGKPMKLSDFRGKVVVLDFWGEWCAPCRAGYTYQNNLIKRLKDEPFVLLGVNCDATKEDAKKAIKDHQLGWAAWQDSSGAAMTGPIYRSYGVTAVPQTFIIDKQGIIREHITGQTLDVLVDTAVDNVLAQGENRPAGAAALAARSTGFAQLGDEVAIGKYHIRPPANYTADKAGRQVYRWNGPQQAGGKRAVFEVSIAPTQAGDNKLEDVLEKDLQAVSGPRLGWNCDPAARGEINGLTFARTHWSIMESQSPLKWKGFGLLYAAVDGDTIIRISHQDSLPNFNNGVEAAPLTFRK